MSGTENENINAINTSTLVQKVKTKAALQAFDEASGTAVSQDYCGVKVVSFYQPVQFDDQRWD